MWLERLKYRLSGLLGDDARTFIPRLLRADGRRHAKRYALAICFMAVVAGSTAIIAYLVRDVVNGIFVTRNYQTVWILAAVIAAVYTVKGFAMYGQAITMARVGNRIVADYQKRLFESVLDQDIAYFAQHHSTEFINRMYMGAVAARHVLELLITGVGRDLLMLIALAIVMFSQDPLISLAGFITLPAAVIGVRRFAKRARRSVRDEFASRTHLLRNMQEAARGIGVVKAYGLEQALRERFANAAADLERAMNRAARALSRASPLMETLGGFAVAGALLYAAHYVLIGAQTPGQFAAVVTAFILSYEPAKRLARLNIDLAGHFVGVRFLFEMLDAPPAEREDASLPTLAVEQGRIEFRDVVFAYRIGEPVLQGVSFVAEPGQTTALVGPSGGGKTTIMGLIERYYEPQAGEILIDRRPIVQFSRRSVREAIAYVSQDVFMFSGTVRDNIAIGKDGATETEIIAAAKAAYAHEFIQGFERGYDTQVGEQGLQLSGGQRARIAIARAFLRNAPILLLDEPTAALDSEAEREIQRALDKLRTSRTTLVIAHRLQTVMAADRICVVESGRIVETGRHAELIARRGRYQRVYEAQFHIPQAAIA
jgi:ATP-binding cassette subfamily B protein